MNDCYSAKKWSTDIGLLDNDELEEFIEHAEKCDYHNYILTGYEKQFLPFFKTILPVRATILIPVPQSPAVRAWEYIDYRLTGFSAYLSGRLIGFFETVRSIMPDSTDMMPSLKFWGNCVATLLLFVTIAAAIIVMADKVGSGGEEQESVKALDSGMPLLVAVPKEPINESIVESAAFPAEGGDQILSPARKTSSRLRKPSRFGKSVEVWGENFSASPNPGSQPNNSAVFPQPEESSAGSEDKPPTVKTTTLAEYEADQMKDDKKTARLSMPSQPKIIRYHRKGESEYAKVRFQINDLSKAELLETGCVLSSKSQPDVNFIIQPEENGACSWSVLPKDEYRLIINTPNHSGITHNIYISDNSPKLVTFNLKKTSRVK